jgi:hypothetical protein
LDAFPESDIGFKVNEPRQKIVDSWPEDCNDESARRDWGWNPDYDMEKAFDNYLIPAIRKRYH